MQVNSNATFIGILECKHLTEQHEDMEVQDTEAAPIPNETKLPHLHVITSFPNSFFETLGLFSREEVREMAAKEEAGELALEKHAEWVSEAREKLLAVLKLVLCGDQVAAEYTLVSLLSAVHSRQNGLALGHVCVNLNNKSLD